MTAYEQIEALLHKFDDAVCCNDGTTERAWVVDDAEAALLAAVKALAEDADQHATVIARWKVYERDAERTEKDLRKAEQARFAQVCEWRNTAEKLRGQRDALIDEVATLKRAVDQWKKSFAGHVYVPTDEYGALCRERDSLRQQLDAARSAASAAAEGKP